MNSKAFNVISNTTPLIALSSIGQLNLLPSLFEQITIAEAVKGEVTAGGRISVPLPEMIEWIKIKPNITDIKERLLFELDEGEKQTILLAIESNYSNSSNRESLLLIDERKGRKTATALGFKVKGTLGILAEAKKRGFIDSFKNSALMLMENNLYYSPKLIDAIASEVDK